ARVAAPVLEVEREPEPRDADAVEPDPRDGAIDQTAQDEEERLHRVEREFETHRLFDRAADRLRRERPRVLAARCAHERRAGGTEARRHLGGGEPREIAQAPAPPALERPGPPR